MAVTEIAMHAIAVSDDRAREDLGDIEELAASIQAVGQLQPIVVRPHGDGYELVAGERRYRAQELLGALMIRAEVRDLDFDQVLVAEAVENGLRKSFTPSEYAWLGIQLEERAKTEDMVGKLPSGDRLSERVAKALGVSDRTYRKARDIVSLAAELNDDQADDETHSAAWQVCDRLVRQMDDSGKVDGAHRQFVALRRLLELAAHDDDEIVSMAESTITRAAEEPGIDLTLEVEGIESYRAPAGSGAEEPSEREEVHGAAVGSDVTSPVASEPAEQGPAWKGLSGAQREALAHLWREGSLRYSNATTETTIYHLVADNLEALGFVSITVPPGGTLDNRCVELTDLGADVMCRYAEEWWPVQRRALTGLASDWQLVEDYAPPSPWEEAGVVFERNGGARFRALTIIGSTTSLSPVLDTLDEAEDFLEASGFETPTRAGGDDDADETGSEPPATPAGARPEGWPPRAESHPSLGAMKALGFSAAFYAAGRQLADWILDGDTPEEAVERLQAGPGHLSDEQLDYVLAHFDVPAPAPDADPGSEPPAPEGVNEDHALEGGEQAPDPSTPVTATTEVEGEAPAGAVPAPLPAGDGEDEFRRSSSPSTTYRRSEKKRPVPMAEFGRLRNVLTEAASIVATVEATDVEPVLAHIDDVDQFIADVQGAIETLTPFLADLRLLARPPG